MKSSTIITKVYRVRNKITGDFVTGGHAAQSGLFISITGAKAGLKNYIKHVYNWGNDANKWMEKDFEIIEYNLVQVSPKVKTIYVGAKDVPLQSSEPGNG